MALVLGSAVVHASWNLIAKQAKGGAGFLWLFAVMTAVIYLPVALTYFLVARPVFTWTHLLFAVVSAVIHVGYFVFLQRGYRVGDLSLVYPLARGSGRHWRRCWRSWCWARDPAPSRCAARRWWC